MKIQLINGGLGCQTFQYIFTRYYELSHPGRHIYLDDSCFALPMEHNGYELEKVFGVKPHMLSECFSADVWEYILKERVTKGKIVPQILLENEIDICMIFEGRNELRQYNPFDGTTYFCLGNEYHPQILELPGNVYYYGFWINKNWFSKFQDIFLQELQFPEIQDNKNRNYADAILHSNSVSIHIRRGDYATLGFAYTPDIYRNICQKFKAEISGKWHLFVFSDDITWCREHAEELGLLLFSEITYIEGNMNGENFRDMQLMSMCEGMIMSNSIFCYLASLLNTRKKFIYNPSHREVW